MTHSLTQQGDPLKLVVLGSFGSWQEHSALALLAAATRARLVAPIIAVTCRGDAERRIALVRASLEQARSPYVPVREAPGCDRHPVLPYGRPIEGDGISDGALAKQSLDHVAAVVLSSGAPLVRRHGMQQVAMAATRTGAPGACQPSHWEDEARRVLTHSPRLTDTGPLAITGAQFEAPAGFHALHAPGSWGEEDRVPIPAPVAPRTLRQRASARDTRRGIAEVGAILAALVYAVRSAEGRDGRSDEQVAADLLATLAS